MALKRKLKQKRIKSGTSGFAPFYPVKVSSHLKIEYFFCHALYKTLRRNTCLMELVKDVLHNPTVVSKHVEGKAQARQESVVTEIKTIIESFGCGIRITTKCHSCPALSITKNS